MKVKDRVQDKVLVDVLVERKAQDAKWGEQNHDPLQWLPILVEEVGEYAEAILNPYAGTEVYKIRREAVQVAAVALAIVECCDRNQWSGERVKGAR